VPKIFVRLPFVEFGAKRAFQISIVGRLCKRIGRVRHRIVVQ
jgi:hypothetical protein